MRGGRRGHWSETWLLRYPSKRPHSPPLSSSSSFSPLPPFSPPPSPPLPPPPSFSSSDPTSLSSLNKILIKISRKILKDSSPPIYHKQHMSGLNDTISSLRQALLLQKVDIRFSTFCSTLIVFPIMRKPSQPDPMMAVGKTEVL